MPSRMQVTARGSIWIICGLKAKIKEKEELWLLIHMKYEAESTGYQDRLWFFIFCLPTTLDLMTYSCMVIVVPTTLEVVLHIVSLPTYGCMVIVVHSFRSRIVYNNDNETHSLGALHPTELYTVVLLT